MTSIASTLPAVRPSGSGLVASAGLTLGGLVLAGIGIALPVAQGFVERGALVASASDAALLAALAPIAPLLLVIGVLHVVVGLAVAQGAARGFARVLAVADALAGLGIAAMAAVAGTQGDARSDLAGAGFLILVVGIGVATALRAGDPEASAA